MAPTHATSAADQLVRLVRLVTELADRQEPPADPPRIPRPRKGAPPARRMRHNQAELTCREQQVLGLLVQGAYNRHLAYALEIPERAVEHHLQALLADFGTTVRTAPRRKAGSRRRSLALLLVPVAGTATLCAAPAVVKATRNWTQDTPAQQRQLDHIHPLAAYGVSAAHQRLALPPATANAISFPPAHHPPSTDTALPKGVATATSFWDRATARGRPMRYRTLASPYWPMGTRVLISYGGKTAIGVVEDFGPAGWAIAQHDVPAIIDISEEMMADLTGARVHAVEVGFEVLEWGTGPVFRTSGPGYALAMGRRQ